MVRARGRLARSVLSRGPDAAAGSLLTGGDGFTARLKSRCVPVPASSHARAPLTREATRRFEDFHVHEIGVDGEVVRLTTTEAPFIEMSRTAQEQAAVSAVHEAVEVRRPAHPPPGTATRRPPSNGAGRFREAQAHW